MSRTSVGILGHTGRIGSQVVKHLIEYHKQGKIRLVILHRPSSNISNLPEDVETRVINLDKDEPDKHLEAIKGLNVVMSILAMDVLSLQMPLLKALAKSDDLVAFTLAEIGSPFEERDWKDPKLAFFTDRMNAVEGLGLKDKWALITSGEYTDYVFGYNLLGSNLKENKLALYRDARTRQIPLATTPYLGAAMAQLTLTDPSKWAGKLIQVCDYAPTGQELIDAFTAVHGGKPTAVSHSTDADIANKADESDFGALEAMLIRHWGDGYLQKTPEIVKESGGWREEPEGWEVAPLQDLLKSYM